MDKFEVARLKYIPNQIQVLLIAETPPKLNSNKYFYFEDGTIYDSLFSETMKILYPEDYSKTLNRDKKPLLKEFQKDGYFLIDSLEKPFEEKYNPSQKISLLKEGQQILLRHIQKIISTETKVILISSTVFKANNNFLKEAGINIINTEAIDFPGSGKSK